MTLSNAQATSARFQEWELRPIERLLLVRGELAAVGSRAFDVLRALVERQGQIVSKGELLDAAWPGLVVEENNVSVQIAALRKLLGAHVISTVAGLGYRLSAVPEEAASLKAVELTNGTSAKPRGTGPARLAVELFGREADIETLVERVGAQPLVSIIGTGGVGKTSLAKVVLSRRATLSHDDVHWIDLAPLRDGGQLVPLVAKSLGIELDGFVSAREDLVSALHNVRALIALDNCEHVLGDVAGLVSQVLDGAPGVRWLATSQEPLHLAREMVYRLEPLDVPGPHVALAEARGSGAIALLCHRAAAADRHFSLNAANLATAVDLCRQLDGLPLAIEMAAARIATLGLQAVHQQLGQRLWLLAGRREGPARHHALRSTFDWSYKLLSNAEQKVFRRLEPLIGGFGSVMAQQIASDPGDGPDEVDGWQALEALSALVDKSLVHRNFDVPQRFFLFESARDYARERLAEAGETAALRRRHAEVVAAWFDSARAHCDQLRDEQWRARYVPERHNVRAALAWACAHREPDLLARLVAALAQIDTFVRGQAEIVQCNVPMDVLDAAAPALRGPACLEFSWAHFLDGSRKTGTALALRALEDFKAVGDAAGAYRALAQLIRLYESRPGMLEEARQAWDLLRQIDDREVPLRTRLFCAITAGLQYGGTRTVARLQELQEMAHRSGFDTLAALCRVHLTDELLVEGRFDEAVEACQRYVDAGEFRPRVKAQILINQVLALVQLGRTAEAHEPARTALRALPNATYLVVGNFAVGAAREGRFLEAALMSGYCDRIRRERDERPDPAEAAAIAETAARLSAALTADRLDELLRSGSAMSASDVLAIAVPP